MMSLMYLWLIPLVLWSIIWKGIGLWKAGRNNDLIWFIVMFIFNTAGVLPILYLVFFQKRHKKKK